MTEALKTITENVMENRAEGAKMCMMTVFKIRE